MKLKNIFFALLLFFSSNIPAAEWQWSVQLPGVVSSETNDHPRAFFMDTFPWNFAAPHNERTLAVLSIHGDAPSTNLTGYCRPNLDWSKLNSGVYLIKVNSKVMKLIM